MISRQFKSGLSFEDKNKQHSIVSHTRVKNMVNTHDIEILQTRFEDPEQDKKVSNRWVPDLTANSSMQYMKLLMLKFQTHDCLNNCFQVHFYIHIHWNTIFFKGNSTRILSRTHFCQVKKLT